MLLLVVGLCALAGCTARHTTQFAMDFVPGDRWKDEAGQSRITSDPESAYTKSRYTQWPEW